MVLMLTDEKILMPSAGRVVTASGTAFCFLKAPLKRKTKEDSGNNVF